MPVVEQVRQKLAAFRVQVDDREGLTPGFKYNDWEMRGVPLRIEIGPKDVEKNSVALARRDRPGKAGKTFVSQDGLEHVRCRHCWTTSRPPCWPAPPPSATSTSSTPRITPELTEAVQNGWALSWWCGSAECEAKVKEDTKATTRCLPLDQPGGTGKCAICGQPATDKVYFARAY